MLFIKKKYCMFGLIVLISLIFLSGCGSSGSDPNEDLVNDSVRTQDFSYSYPAQWETTQNDSFLRNFKDMYNNLLGYNAYSSGAVTKGNNEQRFAIMTLDVSQYQSSITENDLIYFNNSFKYSLKYNNSSATLLEESATRINGQPAIKLSYEINYNPRARIDIIASYKNLNFYIIIYGTEYASDYYDNASLFNEIKNSINLY